MGKLANGLLLFLFLLSGCASTEKALPPLAVAKIDRDRFMGQWYVIASIPTSFESGAHNAIEKYTWNPRTKRVDIEFSFNKNHFDGDLKSVPQQGLIENEETNAEWAVQPIWPFKFLYRILEVAPDYKDTLVGAPNRSYMWIMSRAPQMDEKRYQQLVAKAKAMGYDVSKIRRVPQEPLEERTRTE